MEKSFRWAPMHMQQVWLDKLNPINRVLSGFDLNSPVKFLHSHIIIFNENNNPILKFTKIQPLCYEYLTNHCYLKTTKPDKLFKKKNGNIFVKQSYTFV